MERNSINLDFTPMDGELKELYDLFKLASAQMDREVELVHKRLTWALSFQGFMFASLALAIRPENDETYRNLLLGAIPIAGAFVAICTLFGVYASSKNRNRIRDFWDYKIQRIDPKHDHHDSINLYFPPFYSTPNGSKFGKVPSYGILLSLTVVWIYLFFGFKGLNLIQEIKHLVVKFTSILIQYSSALIDFFT